MCANVKTSARRASKADPVDVFVQYLQGCNMRVTSERLAVVEVITKHSGLFSVAELHHRMEQESIPVSTATLYNTIELLTDSGLLRCLRLADRDQALYRLDTGSLGQIYTVCDICGAVKEVSGKSLAKAIGSHEFSAFAPRTFALTINGLCRKCQKLIKKKQNQ